MKNGTASKALLLDEIAVYREQLEGTSEENIGLEVAEEIIINSPNVITDPMPEHGEHIIAFFSFSNGATYCSDMYYDKDDCEGMVGWLPFPEEFITEPEDLDDFLFEDSMDEGYDPTYYDEEFVDEDKEFQVELGNALFGNSRGKYHIDDREFFQDAFSRYFVEDGPFDGYGFYYGSDKDKETSRGGYENEVFLINPYYWGDDDEIAEEPNFVYKPTGYEIQWYKYPMRDAYCNMDLEGEEVEEIFQICLESMEE